MNHTKGPWNVEKGRDGIINIRNPERIPVADIWLVGEATDANARLIAAAPDLYEALETIAAMAGLSNAKVIARATLAKVEDKT